MTQRFCYRCKNIFDYHGKGRKVCCPECNKGNGGYWSHKKNKNYTKITDVSL